MFDAFFALLTPSILLNLIWGVAGGIFIGALPGLTATMGVALLLPLTFSMETVPGIVLLIGVYVGAIYGGSIPAILLSTPGTPASAATALSGYRFTKRGEAQRALTIATYSSFIGGLVSCVILILVAPLNWLNSRSVSAPRSFFMVAVFGLSIIASISSESLLKGLFAGALGLLVSTIGLDKISGQLRFTYGFIHLANGIPFIPVMIGLFAFSEVLMMLKGRKDAGSGEAGINGRDSCSVKRTRSACSELVPSPG